MKVFFLNRVSDSCSDNLKSKSGPADKKRPRGPKWVGSLAILVLLTGWLRMAEAQQQAKVVKLGEIVFRSRAVLAPEARYFDKRFVISNTLRAKT